MWTAAQNLLSFRAPPTGHALHPSTASLGATSCDVPIATWWKWQETHSQRAAGPLRHPRRRRRDYSAQRGGCGRPDRPVRCGVRGAELDH